MQILKKIFLVINFSFKKLINFLLFSMILFFFKINVYIRSLENFYLIFIYHLNFKNKKKLANRIANFFILKKAQNFYNIYFLNAYFQNNGILDCEKNLNETFFSYQKIVKKILKLEKTIIISPDFFKKIGHFVLISLFIKAIKLKLINEDKILIVGPIEKYNEPFLEKYLKFNEVDFINKKKLDKNIRDNLHILNTYFDLIELNNHKIMNLYQFHSYVSKLWNKKYKNNFFSLSKKEINFNKIFFKKKDINFKKDWFVLLHVRSSPFEKIESCRNSDISKFEKAIKFIISKNGYVIRIGDKSMKRFKELKKFIDLTQDNEQYRKLIFLYANAKFFIVTASGPSALTTLFKSPSIHVDYGPIYDICGKENDFVLPKLYYQNNKLLNYKKRINSVYGKNISKFFLNKNKIKIKGSSDKEILEGVREMYNTVILKKNIKNSVFRKIAKKEFRDNQLIELNISRIIEKRYKNFFYEK